MNINDKIKQILIDKNLTPSYFADEIGVQRSSISHILSGRNRPSFDIIQKIIRRFPDLGYEWIMEEDTQLSNQLGQIHYGIPRPNGQSSSTDRRHPLASTASPMNARNMNARNQRHEIPPVLQELSASPMDMSITADPAPATVTEKKMERILIFYTDGSFREYSPSF